MRFIATLAALMRQRLQAKEMRVGGRRAENALITGNVVWPCIERRPIKTGGEASFEMRCVAA